MASPITGKVARILNDRDIALNIGSDQGVSIGMRSFWVFVRHEPDCSPSRPITSPCGGRVLGGV